LEGLEVGTIEYAYYIYGWNQHNVMDRLTPILKNEIYAYRPEANANKMPKYSTSLRRTRMAQFYIEWSPARQ